MGASRRALWLAAVGLVSLGLVACSGSAPDESAGESTGDVVRMWVGPERVDCVGVAPMECLQVAYAEDAEPQLFYDEIAGFEHQEGTAYVLDVRVDEVADPPADASSLTYTLVTVVSETPA